MNKLLQKDGNLPLFYQFFRKMKLTILIVTMSILSSLSAETYSQTTKLTIAENNSTLLNVLRAIEGQSEFKFFYNEKVDVTMPVSLEVNQKSITEILDKVLSSTFVKYKVIGRQIALYDKGEMEPFMSEQQGKKVTGKVTDSSGATLPGVSVVVKGSTIGIITNMDGAYSLSNVPENAILQFSFIGMGPQEITIGTLTQINVTMVESVIGLEQVVVIGYGTAKRSEITGSIGYLSSKDLKEQPHLNAMDNLRGKVAGVNIFSNSGTPAGNNMAIIRGVGTINSSWEPLYVVDGIQMTSIQYLNPTDIESAQVLKDASAAAIYGARGANGVILITTKRGGKKRGTNVEYTSQYSFGTVIPKKNSMYDPMNSKEFMEVQKISFDNAPYFKTYPAGQEPKLALNNDLLFDSNGNPRYDTNWKREVLRTAFSQSQQLNILSASENSSAGLFLNYATREGLFLNSYSNTANIRFAYDSKLFKWISIGTNIRITPITENDAEIMMGGARSIYQFPPIFPVKWPDGTWSNSSQTQGTNMSFEGLMNPVGRLLEEKRLINRTQLFGDFHVDVHFTPHLELKSQVGINKELYKFNYYLPKSISLGAAEGNASKTNSETTFWQNENYLTYNRDFGDHDVTFMVGASWQKQTYESSDFSVYGFSSDYMQDYNINAAVKYNHPTSDYYDWTMNSYFGRGSYTYKGKYSFTATSRIDGSSRFGKNNKFGFFPSGGISWLVSKENFMSNIKSINLLKLRTSYGISGNTEIGVYKSQATINSSTVLIGGALQPSSTIARIPNPDIKWERTAQFNIGMDINVFNNRISFEGDFYYKKTYDLLLDRPIPETTGFTSVFDNIGQVSNRGVDILITTRNIVAEKFNWTSTLNFNFNKNRIDKLGQNNEDIFPGPSWVDGSQTILRVGEPVGSFWGRILYGIWGTAEKEEAAKVGQLPGMKHWSKDSKITGKGYPDIMGSFINRINVGKFDLMMDLQFSLGADILQQFNVITEGRNALMNGIKNQLYNGWTPERQNTMVQMIRNVNLSGQEFHPDTYWVADGSYLRGNLLALGYTLDEGLLNKLHLNYVRVNVSVQNAFVICSPDLKGDDPESMGFYSKFGQNIFEQQYPKPRTYSLGLTVQF